MTVFFFLVGGGLVAVVAWDIVLTLLHPAARGPLSYATNRVTWSATRGISLRLLRGRGLNYAGPFSVVINLLAWILVLWLGFALIYLPHVDSFSYDPSTPFAAKGVLEALYFSGAAITTVGFGDVVVTGGALRLLAIMEAASGFGVLSAAIAYVLSVYPLISQLRTTGLQLADSGALELEGAVRVVREAGPSEVASIVWNLSENHEHLKRFPVLYYFESGSREESLSAIVRGSSMLLVALHCTGTEGAKYAAAYAEMLERSIDRLLDDLEKDFLGGRARGDGQPDPPAEEAGARLSELCASVCPSGRQSGNDDGLTKQRGALLVRADLVLEALAREHGHDAQRVLPE